MRATTIIQAQPWAITPDALRLILAIANRENRSPSAVAAELGRPLANTQGVTVRDGVAVLSIDGPIFPKANLFTEVSGATSIDLLAQDFNRALNDQSVQAILFDIDSPGGAVSGVDEFANMVYQARGQKPITAYVGNCAASAAYWIASACDGIVAGQTALLGSIGVLSATDDPAKDESGEIVFVSSQSPRKHLDPTSESGKSEIQRMVDELAGVFVGTVARNRGVSDATVISDFGQGGVLVGRSAVAAGLADRMGSFEQTLAATREMARLPQRQPALAKGTTMGVFDGLKAMFAPIEQPEESTAMASTTATVVVDASAFEAEAAQIQAAIEQERVETNASIASLRAQLEAEKTHAADERERAILATADAFADRSISAKLALPAERGALVAQYAQAARDDLASPLAEGSRTTGIRTLIEQRGPHALTQELVAGDTKLAVLANSTAEDTNSPESKAERKKALLAMTPEGQARLAQRN